ncbi:Vms1/Ankzf1 family peptidyl-tRNA hydrolase [Rubrivirga sp.]|uniref:baeRF10 domain-containing protein n=1 Tax=Rubrivirga sp. TaxID=1885344 RepID=UPI003C73FFEE
MLDLDTLRDLADFAGPERAFLTVYLDHGDDPSVLEADLARIRALLSDQPAETEHFQESLTIARELMDEFDAPHDGALAIYTSWAGDVRRAYELPERVGTTVWMGDAPYLRPAYELIEEHETYAAVVLDNDRAKIYLVSADEVDERGRVRGDIKNSVKKGGWSQKRYARRRDKQIEAYATEIADGLSDLEAERSFSRIVLVGSDEPVRAVTEALRQDLRDKLVGSKSVDGNADDSDALEAAAELAVEGEREAEQSLWVQIREQGMGPGLAAFGATSVLEALTHARAEAVLVDREAEIKGTKCRTCEAVQHGTPNTCGTCGSRDVFRVDLVEVMTERAVRTGAEVDFVDPFSALEDVGGVAALLRYALSATDAEQEERERRERAEREAQRRADLEGDPVPDLEDEPAEAQEAANLEVEPPALEEEPSRATALEDEPTDVLEAEPIDAEPAEVESTEAAPVLEADAPALEVAPQPKPAVKTSPPKPKPKPVETPTSDRAPVAVEPPAPRKRTPAWVLVLLLLVAVSAVIAIVIGLS